MKTPTKLLTALALFALVGTALAVPVSADEDVEDADERRDQAKQNAQDRRDAAKDAAQDRRDAAKDAAQDRRDAAKERHDAAHDRFKELAERCHEARNDTGEMPEKCEKAKHLHDGAHKARRAAHAIVKAIDALEHRVARLEIKEFQIEQRLADGNLSENQTAKAEEKLERIEAAQNKSIERILFLKEKLESLKERWDKVKDYVSDQRKIEVCHVGDDGNHTINISRKAWPAHEAHGDSLGACDGFSSPPDGEDASTSASDADAGDSEGSDPEGSDPEGSDPEGSDPEGSDPEGSDPDGDEPEGS